MFVNVKILVQDTTVEKTFDDVQSFKENYLSVNMAHKIEEVVLMDDMSIVITPIETLVDVITPIKTLVGYDSEDKLLGLAYLCQNFNTLEELYESLTDVEGLHCDSYIANEEDALNEMFSEGTAYSDIIKMTVMGDYRWSDSFVRFDGYGNLESTNTLPYEVDFDELYTRYFDVNEVDDVTWTAKVRFEKAGEFLGYQEFSVDRLFYEDAYEAATEEALERSEGFGEDIDMTIELNLV